MTTPTLTKHIAELEKVGPIAAHFRGLLKGWALSGVLLTYDDWHGHHTPEGRWSPRCVALTQAKTQCQSRLFSGQVYHFDDNDNPYVSSADWEVYQAGLCIRHRSRDDVKRVDSK